MSFIVVKNVPPYDGRYELDPERAFNTREWRTIKRAGYMPVTFSDGFRDRDPDLFVALTVIAMTRAGKVERGDEEKTADALAEAPWDGQCITMEADPEADPSPLALTPEPSATSTRSTNGNGRSSGETSTPTLAR